MVMYWLDVDSDNRPVAPKVEQAPEKGRVVGSSPTGTTKKCSKCGWILLVEDFYKRNDKYHSWCKHCEREQDRKRKTPDHHRLKTYNLTKVDFQKMLRAQKGRCGICGSKSKLVVDHSHDSGEIRGLLCNRCNLGIGMLGDTLESVLLAVYYLRGD